MDRYPPKPKYRIPTQADVGKVVEVDDHRCINTAWQKRILLAVLPENQTCRFICQGDISESSHMSWTYARIRCDDEATQ
jgi:hypothetical protein